MGPTVPSFVRSTRQFFNFTRHYGARQRQRRWGLTTATSQVTPAQTAAGLTALEISQRSSNRSPFQAAARYRIAIGRQQRLLESDLSNVYAMQRSSRRCESQSPMFSQYGIHLAQEVDCHSFDWSTRCRADAARHREQPHHPTWTPRDRGWTAVDCTGAPDTIVVGRRRDGFAASSYRTVCHSPEID